MPTQLKRPRAREVRTLLSLVEQHHLLLQIVRLVAEWRRAGRDASLTQDPYARWNLARRRLLLAAAVRVSGALLLLPRISEDMACARKRMTDWTEVTFKEDFRFRKHDFMRILHGMGLGDVHDSNRPRWIRVGTDSTQSLVCSAWALMVLIKRLASTCTYRDLKKVLGGSKTLLCETFLYMLGYVYARYHRRLCDLTWFEPHVDELIRLVDAQCLHHNGMHSPVDNIIGMLDGHFMHTTRPHGRGCRSRNFVDRHVYNGKGQRSLACPRGVTSECAAAQRVLDILTKAGLTQRSCTASSTKESLYPWVWAWSGAHTPQRQMPRCSTTAALRLSSPQ